MHKSDDLLIIHSLRELNFRELMDVYVQTNRKSGRDNYPFLSEPQQMLMAEQDVYTYLKECFFNQPDAYYLIWAPTDRYKAALRLETYRDGYLITALETVPEGRRMGYASNLLNQVKVFLSTKNAAKIYAHIHKKNIASMSLHISCGFSKILDYAILLDGSVLRSYDTYCFVLC